MAAEMVAAVFGGAPAAAEERPVGPHTPPGKAANPGFDADVAPPAELNLVQALARRPEADRAQ
jgi:hypothetical protein